MGLQIIGANMGDAYLRMKLREQRRALDILEHDPALSGLRQVRVRSSVSFNLHVDLEGKSVVDIESMVSMLGSFAPFGAPPLDFLELPGN